MSKPQKTVRLGDFVENPDNPRTISDEAFARLVEKLKAVPDGLTAMRIAYVTDHPAGARVVLSGNTRLRALKKIRGANGEAPAEWFQDITSMTEEQRRKFIVAANKSDGEWDLDRLLEQYGADELGELGLSDLIKSVASLQDDAGPLELGETVETDCRKTVRCPKCGFAFGVDND